MHLIGHISPTPYVVYWSDLSKCASRVGHDLGRSFESCLHSLTHSFEMMKMTVDVFVAREMSTKGVTCVAMWKEGRNFFAAELWFYWPFKFTNDSITRSNPVGTSRWWKHGLETISWLVNGICVDVLRLWVVKTAFKPISDQECVARYADPAEISSRWLSFKTAVQRLTPSERTIFFACRTHFFS